LKYEDTKFLERLKIYGKSRIVKSNDFQIALILSFIFSILLKVFRDINEILADLLSYFITIPTTMITISIAALAIIASFSRKRFILLLKEAYEKKYEDEKGDPFNNILFLFYYSSIISACAIVFTLFVYGFKNHMMDIHLFRGLFLIDLIFFVNVFLVLYSLFIVISLIGTTMRFGMYRGEYIEKKKEEQNSENNGE